MSGGGEEDGEKMDFFWEITLVRPNMGHTHTFNANSSTTGKTLKFEKVCVMIRIQLHIKLPLHQQHTKGNLIKPRITSRGIPTTYHN